MDEEDNTGWQTVTHLDTQPVDIKTEVKVVLIEEPNLGEGLACALNLARQKGTCFIFTFTLFLINVV